MQGEALGSMGTAPALSLQKTARPPGKAALLPVIPCLSFPTWEQDRTQGCHKGVLPEVQPHLCSEQPRKEKGEQLGGL